MKSKKLFNKIIINFKKLIFKLKSIPKFKSIENKFFYFSFLICFIIIIFITTSTYFVSFNAIKNNSIEREKNSLSIIFNQLDIILNSAESLTTNLIINNDIQNILDKYSSKDTYPTKDEYLKLKNQLDNIIYQNKVISGAILHSTNGFKMKSNNKFISLLDGNLLNFNNWYGPIKSINNEVYLHLPKKIFNKNTGKLIGYLEIFVSEDYISKNYKTNELHNKYMNLFLVNSSGIIFSSSDKKNMLKSFFDIRKNISFTDKNIPFKSLTDKKENRLTLMCYYPKLNFNIIGDIYLSNIIYEKKKLILPLIGLLFIGIIFSYILSKKISNSMVKPIQNLFNRIDEIEKGDWNSEINIISQDEIGLLSIKFNKLIFNIKNLMSKISYEQNKKKEFELELMQLQIKPHFLYNSLENICALAELDRNDEVIDMIFNLSTFYRGVLNKGNTIISLGEELNLTESYLKIMSVRYYNLFSYNIECDESIKNLGCLKLLLQPLVENSIYHGIKNNISKEGFIDIIIKKHTEKLFITIKDNGIGITEKELSNLLNTNISSSSKGGFGVKNTIERLNLFFPNEYDFLIKSEKYNGTEITITIPINLKERDYA